MQEYYPNEPKFKDVYAGSNLPKIKDGVYIINLNEYKSLGTHWIEIKKFIGNKSITTNIYRIQENESIMYGCFCIGFIDFILKGKI